MKLINLDEKRFYEFAIKNKQITFHQTLEWAKLKKSNGWEHYFVGLEDNNKILGVTLLLSKKIPFISKNMFYAPRGFLIDYNDLDTLKEFTKSIKEFVKKKNGIFIKIDPYVEYQERDNEGSIVNNGYNNKQSHANLLKLGYKHFGFNKMQDTLQPRWMHVIEINGKDEEEVLKDMESKTRQILRKNEKFGIIVREIKRDELPVFKSIMEHTSDRREFIDRPLSYYEAMWDNLYDSGILKIMVAEIDFDLFMSNTKDELNTISNNLKDRIYKYDNNLLKMNEKKYISSNKKDEEDIKRLNKQIDKINDYIKEYGKKKTLGSILFLVYGNEVLSLYGGTDDNLLKFQSAYSIHYAGIKYAIDNGYKRYNFYGITGDFNINNPLYGLYLFKKSFGGHVVELIGEYDLIISKFWYNTYNLLFKIYHKIKNIKK